MQTYLEKHHRAKNIARFYRMAVMPNLFGEWTLYREWGRMGQGGQLAYNGAVFNLGGGAKGLGLWWVRRMEEGKVRPSTTLSRGSF